MTDLVVAVLAGAALFALLGWLGRRRSACSLERARDGCASCSPADRAACPLRAPAPEVPHDAP